MDFHHHPFGVLPTLSVEDECVVPTIDLACLTPPAGAVDVDALLRSCPPSPLLSELELELLSEMSAVSVPASPASDDVAELEELAALAMAALDAWPQPHKPALVSQLSSSSTASTMSASEPEQDGVALFRGRAPECYQENGRWADDILELSTRQLNRLIKMTTISADQVREIKKARRRKLNRKYAYEARVRRGDIPHRGPALNTALPRRA